MNAHSSSKNPKRILNNQSSEGDAKKLKFDDRPTTSRFADEGNDSTSQTEHFLLVQDLRGQIVDLKTTISQKEQQLLERDKKVIIETMFCTEKKTSANILPFRLHS